MTGSLFDWYCCGVNHKWTKEFQSVDKGISNFSEEIYYEGKHFRKNNEIHIKRMFSTAFEKPKSLTARSLKEKWIKYLQGF